MIEFLTLQTVPTDLPPELVDAVVRILGFGVLSCVTAGSVAFVYRWFSADGIADGVAVLTGVAVVAAWLNTRTALGDAILGGEVSLLDPMTAVYTVAAFAVSAITADGGRRVGDYLARDVFAITAPRTIDEMSQLVRSAGRVVAVDLPETIDDADGYDPVPDETKTELAGTTLLFPRRLTAAELRERLVDRLERDYGVGHVDVEVTVDGTVEQLALGSRPAGLGPTLAPGTVAVAIRADPAPDASSGDAVRVWRRRVDSNSTPGDATDGSLVRVATAELRATIDDVATIALARDDVDELGTVDEREDGPPGLEREREFDVDLEGNRAGRYEHTQAHEYRLVTLPGTPDAGRQFVSLLRAAPETVTAVTVGDRETDRDREHDEGRDRDGEFTLEGESVGALPVVVLAIERDDGAIALPGADERFVAGDVAYLLGRPEAFRRLETEMESPPPSSASPSSQSSEPMSADFEER